MTDERIKEELSNIVSAYMRNPCGEKIDSVLLPYIRASERLAKIEVLEELGKELVQTNNTNFITILKRFESMIAELKEDGE